MSVHIGVFHLCGGTYRVQKRASDSPGDVIIGPCEPPYVSAGIQIWVLWKSSNGS